MAWAGYEAVLRLRRVQPSKDSAEGVVARDAVGQLQEGLQPGQLAPAEAVDVDPGTAAADGGTDGDGRNVRQLVASGAFHPGIVQLSKVIGNIRRDCPVNPAVDAPNAAPYNAGWKITHC